MSFHPNNEIKRAGYVTTLDLWDSHGTYVAM
jgi:hypothetical protein